MREHSPDTFISRTRPSAQPSEISYGIKPNIRIPGKSYTKRPTGVAFWSLHDLDNLVNTAPEPKDGSEVSASSVKALGG